MDRRRQRHVMGRVAIGLSLLALIGPLPAQQGANPDAPHSLTSSPAAAFARGSLPLALPTEEPSHAFPDARLQMKGGSERPPLTLNAKTRLPAPSFWASPAVLPGTARTGAAQAAGPREVKAPPPQPQAPAPTALNDPKRPPNAPGPDSDKPDADTQRLLERIPPGGEREAFNRNLQRWRDLPPEERQALRKQMRQRGERIQAEIDKALQDAGLQLDADRRAVFALRYTQERRKLERRLQDQMNAERSRRLPELIDQLKREFAIPLPAAGDAATPPVSAGSPPAAPASTAAPAS